MVRTLLHAEIKSLSAAAMIIAAASLVSRIVGVFRDRILAGEFGAGATLDMYYAAFRIPDFLFTLLVLGALSAGFIPLFTRLRDKDLEEGWRFAQRILTFFLIGFGIFSLLLFFASDSLVSVMTPGFSSSARATTVGLTRIMLLSPLLLGVSAIVGGVLQSFRRFFVTAIAPIFYNVGIIFGALFLVPRIGVAGLAWGVVAGAFLHLSIQVPTLFALGFRYVPHWHWDDSVRSLFVMMLPRTFTIGVSSLLLFVVTALASSLATGGITSFIFAQNLQSFPLGIIGVSYSIAAFPAFSHHLARGDLRGFLRSFSSTVRQVLFFCLPATVALIVLKAQIVRAALGSGVFDWEDTVVTFQTLQALAFGLIAQSLVLVLARAFWAKEDTWRPAFAAIIGALVTILSAFALRASYGIVGIAYAVSLGSVVQLFCLWILLRIHFSSLDEYRIVRSFATMATAGLVMAEVMQVMKTLVARWSGTETFLGIAVQGGLALTAGFLCYLGVLVLLRSEECAVFIAAIRRRLGFRRVEQLELFDEQR